MSLLEEYLRFTGRPKRTLTAEEFLLLYEEEGEDKPRASLVKKEEGGTFPPPPPGEIPLSPAKALWESKAVPAEDARPSAESVSAAEPVKANEAASAATKEEPQMAREEPAPKRHAKSSPALDLLRSFGG